MRTPAKRVPDTLRFANRATLHEAVCLSVSFILQRCVTPSGSLLLSSRHDLLQSFKRFLPELQVVGEHSPRRQRAGH